MDLTETIKTSPIMVQKSLRRNYMRSLTSAVPGKIIPVGFVPKLREDRVSRGAVRCQIKMDETVRPLMNAINVTFYAHLIPFLAFDRFSGMDMLNRSYKKEPEADGSIVPFFTTLPYDRSAPLLKVMGEHLRDGQPMNAAVVEAYNVLVNFRRKARSEKLPERAWDDMTLAEAFWHHNTMRHIVPDFDQAMIDGEVTLDISANIPIRGLAAAGSGSGGTRNVVNHPVGDPQTVGGANTRELFWDITAADGIHQVFAELTDQNVKLSLANIELAKKTAAFAMLRKKYSGMDDEHLVDLLMSGIRVPDAALSQPILLDRKRTIMGYSERYATDGANLDKSVTRGETFVDLRLRTPPINTGGIILITAEIVPEQLFERREDSFLTTTDPGQLPDFLRDYLDPEKVDIVTNQYVDVEHSEPDGIFGYAPLNHTWRRDLVKVGGKFHRQIGDPFVEDRQRIWGVETVNPALTTDFYLVGSLGHSVFADQLADPFEIVCNGQFDIVGNTVFGKGLHENTDDYASILADVDQDRIDQGEAA